MIKSCVLPDEERYELLAKITGIPVEKQKELYAKKLAEKKSKEVK